MQKLEKQVRMLCFRNENLENKEASLKKKSRIKTKIEEGTMFKCHGYKQTLEYYLRRAI